MNYVDCEIRQIPKTEHEKAGFFVRLQRANDLNWEVASVPYKTYEEAVPRAVNLCRGLGIKI